MLELCCKNTWLPMLGFQCVRKELENIPAYSCIPTSMPITTFENLNNPSQMSHSYIKCKIPCKYNGM